jgi:hypothetical protein
MTTSARSIARLRPRPEDMFDRPLRSLLEMLQPGIRVDGRLYDRVAIPALFRLTPLDTRHGGPAGEAIVVVGKNLSQRGIGFFHNRPIPYRQAVIELNQPELGVWAAEIDLQWCRFTKVGWYESGGRIVRILNRDTPPAKAG